MVELHLAKVDVAGSSPVSRSTLIGDLETSGSLFLYSINMNKEERKHGCQ